VNEKAVARVGRQCHKEKENYIFEYVFINYYIIATFNLILRAKIYAFAHSLVDETSLFDICNKNGF
jgi:hypothetical protein